MLEVSGADLRAEREAADISQEELARAMDVSVKTVQRIEGAELVKARSVDGYRMALSRASDSPDLFSSRPWRVSEQPSALVPAWLERRIEDTMLELARSGATNEQARYIRDVLMSEATLRFVLRRDDGSPRSAQHQETHIRDLIDGLRMWVERSAEIRAGEEAQLSGDIKQSPAPGGAPIAPVAPAPRAGKRKPGEPDAAEE